MKKPIHTENDDKCYLSYTINSLFHLFFKLSNTKQLIISFNLFYSFCSKRKHLKDEENINDFHVDLRSSPSKAPRVSSRISDSGPHRQRNGTARPPPPEVHDNIALDDYSIPTAKNYFQEGLESEAIEEALDDLKDYQIGGSGSAIKMREKPAYPARGISTKSRISVGPVLMEDEIPSTQNIYDKVYTHNTFKLGK